MFSKDRVVSWRDMQFTLTTNKCSNKEISKAFDELGLKPEYVGRVFDGTVTNAAGKKKAICYVAEIGKPNNIALIDEDGDGGIINLDEKKSPGL